MILLYIAAGVFRIPMTVFEISFLGIKFTVIRLIGQYCSQYCWADT
ncbi:MAG: hypothetical protein SVK54_00470 [candidate division WOR-3 bacterium]|nr:hypothetical protein [candidate division WOR-3 bacterium]